MKTLVMDIGGTHFRSGIFTEDKKIISLEKFNTPNFINNPSVSIENLQKLLVKAIAKIVKKNKEKYKDINSVGLSFAGPVTKSGVARSAATIWGKRGHNYPIYRRLKEEIPNIRWLVVNDITAATERYGQMDKYQSMDFICVITISSGVGNKIFDISNRKTILDRMSVGGELGHVQYDLAKNSPKCDCGGKGHISSFCSGRAMERLTIEAAKKEKKSYKKSILRTLVEKPEDINNKLITQALKMSDKFTLDILDVVTFPMAYSISYLSGAVGINRFIFIGGFALNLGDVYINSLKKSLNRIAFFHRTREEVIELVELGINDDMDCLIGVGLLSQKLEII